MYPAGLPLWAGRMVTLRGSPGLIVLLPNPCVVRLVTEAVAAACGAKEAGGLVADPRQCGFKPSSLRCTGDASEKCLSEAEVGVLEKWYAGPTDAAGRPLYPGGIPLGSEAHWPRWLTGLGNAPAILPLFSADFLRYMAFWPSPGPAYRVTDFDFSADPARMAPQAQPPV